MNRNSEGIRNCWAIPLWELEEKLGTSDETKIREALGATSEGDFETLNLIETIGLNPQMFKIVTEIDEAGKYLVFHETPDDWAKKGRFASQKIRTKHKPNKIQKRLEDEGFLIEFDFQSPNPYQDAGEENPETIHLHSGEALLKTDNWAPLFEKAGLQKEIGVSWGDALWGTMEDDHERNLLEEFGQWTQKEYGSVLIPNIIAILPEDEEVDEEITVPALPFFTPQLIKKTKFGPIAKKTFALGIQPTKIEVVTRWVM